MKPSRHPRRTAYCAAWSSTTPQSMPAGSIWSRSRSACCAASASTAASARATASSPKLPPGNSSATPPAPASPGCSPPSALAPKWPALTPTLPKCHNPCAEVLAAELSELIGETGLVFETSQIEDNPPSLDTADHRDRQSPQPSRQRLDRAASRSHWGQGQWGQGQPGARQ